MTEELCGTTFSKSLISSLAGSLDAELQAWRKRQLQAKDYPYLFVDARYEKVRVDGRVVSQGVPIVSGVRDDGYREIHAVEVADTESEATYQELFRSLKRRGLVLLLVGLHPQDIYLPRHSAFKPAVINYCVVCTGIDLTTGLPS